MFFSANLEYGHVVLQRYSQFWSFFQTHICSFDNSEGMSDRLLVSKYDILRPLVSVALVTAEAYQLLLNKHLRLLEARIAWIPVPTHLYYSCVFQLLA